MNTETAVAVIADDSLPPSRPAPATRAAYESDFAAFQSWCAGRGVSALPALPTTVAAYLAAEAEAGLRPSTIGRRCAAIRHAHRLAGHEPPTNAEIVRTTRQSIRRAVRGGVL